MGTSVGTLTGGAHAARVPAAPRPALRTVPVVIMRGGTSKGAFVLGADIPGAGPERDQVILELMGSPDPMQLDGLGGTHSSTSKVMILDPGREPGTDVEYTFAQVGIEDPIVDYGSNCGNLTAAVGVYAIEEGLVPAVAPVTAVRLVNRNTGKRIVTHVPVSEGRVVCAGEQYISGVPRPGAAIVTEYLDPGGSRTGETFPTGHRTETLRTAVGEFEVSLIDVAQPVVFLRPEAFGLHGDETPATLNADAALLDRVEAVRAAAAVALGLVDDPAQAREHSATVPRIVFVSPGHNIRALSVSVGRFHHAVPVTGAICLAAGALLKGTIPFETATVGGQGTVRIEHPKGYVEATVTLSGDPRRPVESVGLIRTARRLMEGTAYLP